ncbi:MAG: tRNA (adenine-N1)-methyltransferase [Candidatus Altiarchaeota archaeon]|nr:tRNA (adenine-N1)-methyltransferase [Candidatus Altiarchaeota archaeon]
MYLLIDEKGRHYLVRGDSDVHTNYGVIKADDLKEENIGGEIETHTGRRFFLVRPDALDFIKKAKKGPQSVTLKDCGLIIAYTGVRSGSKVVDAGTGSGITSMFLANIVYPERLTTYEVREDFSEIARENFRKARIDNIELKMKSIYDGIDETDLDLINLDLPEPWRVVEHARSSLKVGGFLVSYSPSIEQSKKFHDELEGFESETVECLVRNWDMKIVRPYSRMLGHTGFLTFARLIKR